MILNRPVYYIGNHTVLTTLCYGPKIFLNTDDIVQNHMMYYGFWEQWVSNLFLDYIQPGMTVLDIGAHCGYYTLLAASKVGNEGKVISFEPNPQMVHNATRSLLINGYDQVEWHAVGLSNESKMMNLVTPISGGGSLEEKDELDGQQVKTVVLSEFMPELKADVIKVDVDGWEPYILPCLYRVIERSNDPVVFMEYSPKLWRMHRFEPEECLSYFVAHGYEIKIVEHNGDRRLTSLDELASVEPKTHLDLLMEKA